MTDKTFEELESDLTHDAYKFIEKLQKRIEELEKQREWQPIETAPQDASAYLGDNGEWRTPQICSYGMTFYAEDLGKILHRVILSHAYTPTHWMPLPQLPQIKGA